MFLTIRSHGVLSNNGTQYTQFMLIDTCFVALLKTPPGSTVLTPITLDAVIREYDKRNIWFIPNLCKYYNFVSSNYVDIMELLLSHRNSCGAKYNKEYYPLLRYKYFAHLWH